MMLPKWILSIIFLFIIASIALAFAILSRYDFKKVNPVIMQKVKDIPVGGDLENNVKRIGDVLKTLWEIMI